MNPRIRNNAAADLIAKQLVAGLAHPGNPTDDTPKAVLNLPMFKTVGMPPPMKANVEATTLLVSEAIVYLLEDQGYML